VKPWTFAGVLFVVITHGWMCFELGLNSGKKQGYAICVSEEDDDHVRTRKF